MLWICIRDLTHLPLMKFKTHRLAGNQTLAPHAYRTRFKKWQAQQLTASSGTLCCYLNSQFCTSSNQKAHRNLLLEYGWICLKQILHGRLEYLNDRELKFHQAYKNKFSNYFCTYLLRNIRRYGRLESEIFFHCNIPPGRGSMKDKYLQLLALTVRSSLTIIKCPLGLGRFKTERVAYFCIFFISLIYRTFHVT